MLKEQFDNQLSIRYQARLLDVSRSIIYYNEKTHDDTEVANLILDIYSHSDCRYGYRKVHMELIGPVWKNRHNCGAWLIF